MRKGKDKIEVNEKKKDQKKKRGKNWERKIGFVEKMGNRRSEKRR